MVGNATHKEEETSNRMIQILLLLPQFFAGWPATVANSHAAAVRLFFLLITVYESFCCFQLFSIDSSAQSDC